MNIYIVDRTFTLAMWKMSALQRCVINKISLTQEEYVHKLQQPDKLESITENDE